MPRQPSSRGASQRRAAILLVVVVLLMLFLVIGICFVLFAEAQATASRFYREANLNIYDKYPTPEEMFGWALGELIYDSPDVGGEYSAMRGHSLARNMYGWNYRIDPATGNMLAPINPNERNETAFNGAGRLSTGPGTAMNPWGDDDKTLINYTYYPYDAPPFIPGAVDYRFKRNPERWTPGPTPDGNGPYTAGWNPPYTYPDLNHVYLAATDGTGHVTTKSFWREESGFLHPSQSYNAPGGPFHPTAYSGPGVPPNITTSLDPRNLAWIDSTIPPGPPSTTGYNSLRWKYKSLRPRPVDQLFPTEPQDPASVQALLTAGEIFPLPKAYQDPVTGQWFFGDVRNLPGNQQEYDAIWMDLGYPVVRLAASQKKIKPLFAITVVDLDGRVNLNVAGNAKGVTTPYHTSLHGFGPWEINPRRLMEETPDPLGGPPFPAGGNDEEYMNLFRGVQNGSVTGYGRYGLRPTSIPVPPEVPVPPPTIPFPNPSAANLAHSIPGRAPKFYARVDWDGSHITEMDAGNQHLWLTSGRAGTLPPGVDLTYSAFPYFPSRYQDGSSRERYMHASLFNPFRINTASALSPITNDEIDQTLLISDMQGLIRWDTPPGPSMMPPSVPFPTSPDIINTGLGKLWPSNLIRYPKLKNLITTHSMDLDVPGVAPGIGFVQGVTPETTLVLNPDPTIPGPNRVPTGASHPVFNDNTATSLLPNRNAAANLVSGDMIANDWRSIVARIGKVDLNRPLTNFPPATGQLDPTNATDPNWIQHRNALRDRVLLARDIFFRLRVATGASDVTPFVGTDPNTLPETDPNRQKFEALRYLAQLAANIVDFIDEDDSMTPFNFIGDQMTTIPPGWGWVFGTELPRLVINETYAQINNAPADDFGVGKPRAANGVSDPDSSNPAAPDLDMDGKATQPYRVNFFIELHNPLNQDTNLSDGGAARLQFNSGLNGGPRNIYRILVRSNVDLQQTNATSNVLGDPKVTGNPLISTSVLDFASDNPSPPMIDTNVVLPANRSYTGVNGANNGYVLLGPNQSGNNWQHEVPRDQQIAPTATHVPTISVADQDVTQADGTTARSRLFAELPQTTDLTPGSAPIWTDPNNRPSVFLQRVAIPHLPPQPDPTQPNFNPYITVDYVSQIPVQDAVLYSDSGPRWVDMASKTPLRTEVTQRISYGRRQPYKAVDLTAQAPNPAPAGMPRHTFFRQNGTGDTSDTGGTLDPQFRWLVHYDRRLASPADLVHVSGLKPHELTQFFENPSFMGPLSHRIPWRAAHTRLYRAFELMGVRSFMHGVPVGGRVTGKVNVNTMPSHEVFEALADPQAGNYFNQAHVYNVADPNDPNTAWGRLNALRPLWSAPPFSGATGGGPVPDLQYPRNGADATLLRGDPTPLPPWPAPGGGITTPLLFGVPDPTPQNHQYVVEELFKKILNNVTTRSNVFAVYITTGFFYVRDLPAITTQFGDAYQPVKLGREVDASLRHKMFAIIDRTNLTISSDDPDGRTQGMRPIFWSFEPIDPADPVNPLPVVEQGAAEILMTVPAHWAQGNHARVRDTIDHFGSEYKALGNPGTPYTGEVAELVPGKVLYLDTGLHENGNPKMEPVVITQVNAVPNDPTQTTIRVRRVDGQPIQFNHHRGCPVCTERLGNPGPLIGPAKFMKYDEPPYANTVVPFRAILQ